MFQVSFFVYKKIMCVDYTTVPSLNADVLACRRSETWEGGRGAGEGRGGGRGGSRICEKGGGGGNPNSSMPRPKITKIGPPPKKKKKKKKKSAEKRGAAADSAPPGSATGWRAKPFHAPAAGRIAIIIIYVVVVGFFSLDWGHVPPWPIPSYPATPSPP